jgi:drug/metabolite transporter (DMT)-like permease
MKLTGLLDIFILAMLWGPSFLFTKRSLGDIPPLTLVTLRISLGTLLLFLVLKFKNIRFHYNPRLWMHCFIIGLFANGLPFICFSYSLVRIPSNLSALINGSTPVFTLLLANIFLKDERLNWQSGIGVVMGLLGFLVLFLPSILKVNVEFNILGMLLSLMGASSYAIAIVYARKHIYEAPPVVMPMLQLLTSLSYLIPLAFIFETPVSHIQSAKLTAWGGVLGLGILGTLLAFLMYYRIIARQGATAVAMVSYLLPIIGTILGVVFLKEKVSIYFGIAGCLILSGVLIVNRIIPLPIVKPKGESLAA